MSAAFSKCQLPSKEISNISNILNTRLRIFIFIDGLLSCYRLICWTQQPIMILCKHLSFISWLMFVRIPGTSWLILSSMMQSSWSFVSLFFLNWDSLHARLNSHYKDWSTRKEAQKRLQDTENLFRKNLQLKDVC